jgi:hypothetical protein
MPDQNITQWRPNEEKGVRLVINGLIGLVLVGAACFLIKTFVPTIADALVLLQKLLANAISTALTAAVLAVVLWLLYETFSPKGKINSLFAQGYSSFVHNLTLEMLNVDPMSPLKDARVAAQAKKDEYDEAFSKFDGAISTAAAREDQLRADATHIEAQAKQANAQGNTQMFQRLAYQAGEETKTANEIGAMRQRLVPVRDIIKRMQTYAGDLIWKLDIDIKNTQTKWEMANSMNAMDKTARGFLKNSGKSDLALEAFNLVQTNYSAAIGHLENLDDLAKPLLDSADLDKGTYSMDLLTKWQSEASDSAIPIPVMARVVQPVLTDQSSFSKLI